MSLEILVFESVPLSDRLKEEVPSVCVTNMKDLPASDADVYCIGGNGKRARS